MLEMFHGRVDRKTFIIGNFLALSIFLAFSATVAIPLAIIDLVINGSKNSTIFGLFYYFIIIPAFLYFLYFLALVVRRIHDIGYPGLLVVGLFTVGQIIGRKADLWIINLICLLLLAALCIFPGQKGRNKFGNKPSKRFSSRSLRPNI